MENVSSVEVRFLPEACSCPVNTDMEAISTASQKEGKINKVAMTTETVQQLYSVEVEPTSVVS